MKKIGFIGLGVMGKGIAANISKKYPIIVFNRTKSKSVIFKKKYKKNIQIAESYKEIARNSNIIITCVGNDKDLDKVFFSKEGLLNNVSENTYIIDHSTVSFIFSKNVAKRFKDKKCFFFDAPVSGGEIGAINGSLSIMMGGNRSKLKKIKHILQMYSKKISYMGDSGSGQITKMVNQICIAGLIQSLSEGLNFGKKNGLKFESLFSAISSGAAQSWQMDNRAQTMWKNQFNFGFMNKHMYKDLDIVKNHSKQKKIDIPVTLTVMKLYRKLLKEGHGQLDTSSLIKLLK